MTFEPEVYARDFPYYKVATKAIRESIESALAGSAHSIQEIQARAKHPDSAAEKQFRGGEDPKDPNDLIGIRVVTLYDNAVPAVVERLRTWFDEVPDLYKDKSQQLTEKEVGYRGVHLFLTNIQVSSDALEVRRISKSSVVEVQVKSLAAHTWAEAEHTLRYKAGDGVPEQIARRFNSLAGALELIDRELNQIQLDIVAHVAQLSNDYSSDRNLDTSLSSLQLLAVLAGRSNMPAHGPHGLKMDIEDAFRLAKVLTKIGIRSVRDLQVEVGNPAVTRIALKYFELKGTDTDPDAASSALILGAIIGRNERNRLRDVELFRQDAELTSAVDSVVGH